MFNLKIEINQDIKQENISRHSTLFNTVSRGRPCQQSESTTPSFLPLPTLMTDARYFCHGELLVDSSPEKVHNTGVAPRSGRSGRGRPNLIRLPMRDRQSLAGSQVIFNFFLIRGYHNNYNNFFLFGKYI